MKCHDIFIEYRDGGYVRINVNTRIDNFEKCR